MIHWGTFGASSRAKRNVNDPTSRFHAFEHESDNPKFSEIRFFTRSVCGRLPRHGWGSDLYLEDYCQRCIDALYRRMGEERSIDDYRMVAAALPKGVLPTWAKEAERARITISSTVVRRQRSTEGR